MQDSDFEKFARVMAHLAKACVGESLGKEKLRMYFAALKDKSIDDIVVNASLYLRSADPPYFPSVAKLAGEKDPELAAMEAFHKLQDYVSRFYRPNVTWKEIADAFEKNEDTHLIPHYKRWVHEIANTTSVSVTRSHFIKSFQAEEQTRKAKQLTGQSQTLLEKSDTIKES